MSKKNRANDRAERAAAALARAAAPGAAPAQPDGRRRRRRHPADRGRAASSSRAASTPPTDVDADAPAGQRVRPDHRPGRRAPQGGHLRGLPLPVLRRAREARAARTSPQLADDGKVQVEYRPFILLGRLGALLGARDAASGRSCSSKSGAEVAKKFHDLLYENQPSEEGPVPERRRAGRPGGRGRGRRGRRCRTAIDDRRGRGLGRRTPPRPPRTPACSGTPTVLLDGEVVHRTAAPSRISASNLIAGGSVTP